MRARIENEQEQRRGRRSGGRQPERRRRGQLSLVSLSASPAGNHSAVVEHYARLAPIYDGRWDLYTRRTLSLLLSRIELETLRPRMILDVACGTGRLTQMIHEVTQEPRPHVTGVDLSPQMIDIARQRMPEAPGNGVEWAIAPAEELPVGDGLYDVVTCANAFHLVTDPHRTLTEFRRVLKPGGRIVILDWCREYPTMALVLVMSRLFGKQYRRIYTVEELTQRLEECAFSVSSADKLKATWFWGTMCLAAEKIRKPAAPETITTLS